jgi:hypothetical protein
MNLQTDTQLTRPSNDDALRLVTAFFCIMEPEKRAELLALTERYASTSQPVDGITHFLMLKDLGEAEH